MKIISMEIKNVLGLREFKLDAGQITEIRGRNAEGKTSILSAIQNAIGGGSLKDLRNVNSEDPARIVLALRDDNGTNYVLDKTEKALKLKRQVGDSAGFETVGRPQNFLNTLRDCRLMNPMDFINAKNDKERAELILQAIKLPFSSDDLWTVVGFPREDFGFYPDGMNPLNEISTVRKMVFEKRTGVNTTRRDKRAACEENRRSVPAEIPTVDGITEKEKELSETRLKAQELKDTATSTRDKMVESLESDYNRIKEEAAKALSSFIDSEEKHLEIEIAKLRSDMRDRVDIKRAELSTIVNDSAMDKNDAIKNADAKYNADMAAIAELQPEIEQLAGDIAAMREQEKNIVMIRTIHQQADKLESEANSLDGLADELTEALGRIDAYKVSMAANLPVPGLDIADNVVTINGVPWGQLNTAATVVAAVQIIAERAKNLPFKFVVIDHVESLDSNTREILNKELLSNDIQAVLGRVADTDMEVIK